MDRQGGCGCGAVRYETVGEPKFVAHCHCASCRRYTGAAFSTWVGFTDDQVNWINKPARVESSPGVGRSFCPNCGTPLSYQGAKWPGETHLTIGSFDDASGFSPKGGAFPDEALPWVRSTLGSA